MKPTVTAALALSLFATQSASADTVTTEADTLVVVTPNAPVVVQQGGPAIQPPGAAEMPPSAPTAGVATPQNEDWNNVSHINGTPVKVGERSAYLYKFKKTNISGNPFGPFFDYYDLAVSHALGQNLVASVAISGWDVGNSGGYQISATLPLYFRRAYSGPFLEGGLLMRTDMSESYTESYDQYGNAYSYETMDDSSSWIGPQLMFGWHSTFDSGLNVAFAAGFAKRLESNGGTEGNAYFRVGYAF
jgi:hypothetical protein